MRTDNRFETLLAFGFGTTFCIVLLVLAFAIKEPSNLAVFVTRVILALSAAGIGAVIPGILNVAITAIPGVAVRSGGALALGSLVYLVNPPALVQQSKQIRSSLMDVQFALARQNLDWAAGKMAEIARILPKCPDVTYLQGVIERKRGHFAIAQEYFSEAEVKEISSESCDIALEPAEISYQQALIFDEEGKIDQAIEKMRQVKRLSVAGSTLYGDSLFEIGRLSLLLLTQQKPQRPENDRLVSDIEQSFTNFLDGQWPGILEKHWAKYHLACLHAHIDCRAEACSNLGRFNTKYWINQFISEIQTVSVESKNFARYWLWLDQSGFYEYAAGSPVRCMQTIQEAAPDALSVIRSAGHPLTF